MGYSSCSSCHVSPSGGGVLTKYGRSLSEEMSTWSYENEGQFLYYGTPDWLLLGGDIRWVNVSKKSDTAETSKIFFMQTEAEVALSPIKGLTFVGSVGKYNEGNKYEFRRNFVLLDIGEHFHFRLGKYFSSYGLFVPDHTSYTHPGQGNESYNLETSVLGVVGEFTLGAIGGRDRSVQLTDKDGYKINDEANGYNIKGSLFLFSNNVIGYSYLSFNDDRHGPYAILSMGDTYLLTQFDFLEDGQQAFNELGYEVGRGITSSVGYQWRIRKGVAVDKFQAKVTWFPRPHFEFQSTYEYEIGELTETSTYLFMSHFWL